MYHGLVRPILSYGIVCWGMSSHVLPVFNQQKRIGRIMDWTQRCRDLFVSNEILTFASTYVFFCLCNGYS